MRVFQCSLCQSDRRLFATMATKRLALRPLSRGNDPTYLAIDAHRKARAAADVEIVKNDDLEAAIPKDKRKTRRHD